jgi:dTDP-4-dehydrorhamnose reductase
MNKITITDDKGRLGKVLAEHYPIVRNFYRDYNVIIHNGAYTDVDGAENDINTVVSQNIIETEYMREVFNRKVIYLSTDFVFDGEDGPYYETDDPAPLGVYGWTKWMGERVLHKTDTIVRTTVLYGGHKPDFVTWVLDQYDAGEPFEVSSAMITSPTNVYHLAQALKIIAEKDIDEHIINVAGGNVISRYAFAEMIGRVFEKDLTLLRYTEETNFGFAPRPQYAGLRTNFAHSLGIPIYSVFDGLHLMRRMMDEN